MKFYTFIIERSYNSIYYFLKDKGFSENYISNLRKAWGNFVVNGEVVNIRKPLNTNDKLEINSSPNTKTTIMHCILPLDIVYEDEYYLLINKPSGISTMPNRSHYSNNLAGAICSYMKEKDENFVLRISNRLDKETSGIVIVAKDSIALKSLNAQKTYYALCEGVIESEIIIDEKILTINENGINQIKRIISPLGKDAKTFIKPIKNDGIHTLLEIKLEHGRTHQIRVHMSHIGHALAGDRLYGKASQLINRTALHCGNVEFYHEFKKELISVSTPLPDDFFIK
jgi:23S rRNA pseudouridine1911/1915/1917 synthase